MVVASALKRMEPSRAAPCLRRADACIVTLVGLLMVTCACAQASGNATIDVGDTPVPETTTGAPPTEAPFKSTELDIRFKTWSDELLVAYLQLFADVTGVPVRRFVPVYYGAVTAIEFGEEYIFTVRIGDRSNQTSARDVYESPVVAEMLEQRLLALIGAQDARVKQRTILHVVRVVAEKRVTEKGSLSVNYMWVAFLLLGVGMLGASGIVLIRRRTAAPDDGLEEDHQQREVPKDELTKNAESLLRLVEKAEHHREREAVVEREREIYAPNSQLFTDMLNSDFRLQLPPRSTKPDPLAPSLKPAPTAAQPAVLGAAAQSLLERLHDDFNDTPAPAPDPTPIAKELAVDISPPRRAPGQRLRDMHEQVKLMDANDDDL
jgi:hypothetical protein